MARNTQPGRACVYLLPSRQLESPAVEKLRLRAWNEIAKSARMAISPFMTSPSKPLPKSGCGWSPLPLVFRVVIAMFGFAVVDALRADSADVVVYGGSASGVIAGVQAARMGKSAIIVEPG